MFQISNACFCILLDREKSKDTKKQNEASIDPTFPEKKFWIEQKMLYDSFKW